jgi:hypothetical protein
MPKQKPAQRYDAAERARWHLEAQRALAHVCARDEAARARREQQKQSQQGKSRQ